MKSARAWLAMGVVGGLLLIVSVAMRAGAQAREGGPEAPMRPGSRVVSSAEPNVPRPSSTPCMVTLARREAFDDRGDGSSMAAHAHRLEFAPPRGCAGAWSKVVLVVDFSVPAGRQFDRTATIWLGGVNLYFGATMEPEPDLAQHWQVERDLTGYTALFHKAQTGQIILNNSISPTTNQPIYVTAKLLFYPVEPGKQAPRVANRVFSLSSEPAGKEQPVQTSDGILSRRLIFPRDVERASLDVIAQSQAHDERWYTCVDKRYLAETREYSLEAFEACDGGSFRGVEVLVDGRPAGLAPVYPWIFAGGIGPHLWLPTPGIQTTNFLPFRVDLTPFAGVLDDGRPHSIGVRVLGADHFFNLAANLLVYEERLSQGHSGAQLSGDVLEDTLGAAQPAGLSVQSTLHPDASERIVGTLQTHETQSYLIRGELRTPRGNLVTTVRYQEQFLNDQTFIRPGAKQYLQMIRQSTVTSMAVERDLNGRHLGSFVFHEWDPVSLIVRKTMVTKGQDFYAKVSVWQGHRITLDRIGASGGNYKAALSENLNTSDREYGKTIPPPLDRSNFDHDESGQEIVQFRDSLGSCYTAQVQSQEERVTGVREGVNCPGGSNHLDSDSRPDNPWLMPLIP
ncbi:MAG: peptide-N4-asparagine amidase [Acidobacteriota bacterium]